MDPNALSSQDSSSSLKILLVEDNQHDAIAFQHAFKKHEIPCEITACTRAEEALNKLRVDASLFDLVVTDYHLPGMSGLALSQAIIEDGNPLPIVILTAVGTEQLAAEALQAGVDDYIVKDVDQGYLKLLPIVLPHVVQKYRDQYAHQQMQNALEQIFDIVERAKQEWEATVDALSELVGLLDSEGRILRANRTVEAWNLAPVNAVRGKRLTQIFQAEADVTGSGNTESDLLTAWPDAWQTVLQGQAVEFEIRDSHLDRDLLFQIRPIPTDNGQTRLQSDSFATLVVQDITERKQAEEMLQHSLSQTKVAFQQAKMYAEELQAEIDERQKVEAALRRHTAELQTRNEELDAFGHTVAHDLKDPLGPIIGYAELARNTLETTPIEETKTLLDAVSRNGRKMEKIIDSLLILSGVRNMEVELAPLNMAEIVNEALTRIDDVAKRFEAEVTWPDEWPMAYGFAPWVEEVWVNYLSNGLKYGGRPPKLALGATPQPDGTIKFWVRDNGKGLNQEELGRLFTPFTRLNKVRIKGHGLGLSIVHRIVQKLGGEVGAESEGVLEEGSQFYFTLLSEPPPEKQAPIENSDEARP